MNHPSSDRQFHNNKSDQIVCLIFVQDRTSTHLCGVTAFRVRTEFSSMQGIFFLQARSATHAPVTRSVHRALPFGWWQGSPTGLIDPINHVVMLFFFCVHRWLPSRHHISVRNVFPWIGAPCEQHVKATQVMRPLVFWRPLQSNTLVACRGFCRF